MQNNLFFLCGPHGSGKTTLASLLAEKENVLVPELFSRTIKLNTDPKDRLVLKICQRSLENFEYLETARRNPDKIVLGNRCIYDQLTYNLVYAYRGWLDKNKVEKYNLLSENLYINSLKEPFAIVLNPGFDVVKKHLEKRWQEKGKKWREDDWEYDRLACDVYEQFKDNEKIFYINHEIDLNSGDEISRVYEWMKEIKEGVPVFA
ncbi:MAG: AAA family ATPase [Candidatus Nanoarchaeia archaeon]|nr:AAA family ATPase [Candidatus Nanoarchaeia archaeon]MDD5740421.1 AAA family ATPase [Candidatus Nanoarchaeia archaeon]